MKLRFLQFYIKEAYESITRNKWMILVSVFTVFFCLALFGFFLILSMNAGYLIDTVNKDYNIPVFVDGDLSHEELNKIASRIRIIPGILKIEIMTKEDCLKLVKETLNEYQGLTDGIDRENPLKHTIKVSFSDLTQAEEIVKKIGYIKGATFTNTRQGLVDTLIRVSDFINGSCFWIILVLGIVCVSIISNTIKLSVHARQKEIHTMRFVGGTDWCIRWPFLIEGILVGLAGCAFAFFAVSFFYRLFVRRFSEISPFTLLGYSDIWLPMLVFFILSGVILGAAGSLISIRKYLKG